MGEPQRVSHVFVASTLLAQAKGEPGSEAVGTLLADPNDPRLVHAANVCEVYYKLLQVGGELRAVKTMRDLRRVGLRTRRDLDRAFWHDVAGIKADIQRVSLGDGFAIALARRLGGTVVTSDRAEFGPVGERGVCSVMFIR